MNTPQPRADVCAILDISKYSSLGEYKQAIREWMDKWWHKEAGGVFTTDVTDDLNACHEWEERIGTRWIPNYVTRLCEIVSAPNTNNQLKTIHATALQRCESRILMESLGFREEMVRHAQESRGETK
jgi:hypothetical protein